MSGRDDRFDDVYDGKFDLDPEMDLGDLDPADSRALDELAERADPDDVDVEALVDVGVEYVDINRFEQAAEAFERAVRFADEDEKRLAQEALVNKGYAHAEMGEHDRALGAYREALEIDDGTEEAAMALTNMAYAKWEAGRGEDAIRDLNRALDIDEKRPEAWYNKGFFLNEEERYEDALRSFDNAIALGLRNADLLDAKATALEGLERYEEAEALREEAQDRREEDVREVMRE